MNKYQWIFHRAITLLLLLTMLSSTLGPLSGVRVARAQETTVYKITPLLSDGQFVYGPNVENFDVAKYLATTPGIASQFAETIECAAGIASINPQVLLTLLELYTGTVTDASQDVQVLNAAWGFPQQSFTAQLNELTALLNKNFYWYLDEYQPGPNGQVPIQFMDGTIAYIQTDNLNAATYAIAATVGQVSTAKQWETIVLSSDAGFQVTFRKLFPTINALDSSNTIRPVAVPPDDLFQFPFPQGTSWYFNGPHGWDGTSRPFSSIDFSPTKPFPRCGGTYSQYHVVAAAPGDVEKKAACWLRIKHAGGWTTEYYHLTGVRRSSGHVERNEYIANIGCETCVGGSASGAHVHFTLLYNGAHVSLDGVKLSGWTVHVGEKPYTSGYLERNGVKKNPYERVLNDYDSIRPHTIVNLNNEPDRNRWPTWFTVPVSVHLQASDQDGSGVKEVHYKLDSGSWQTRSGNNVSFTVSGNGSHTLKYYAKDKAGNQENTHTVTFNIDTSPPSAPGTISEGHGIASGVWQSDVNDPNFTWGAASDTGSGIRYYRVEWGDTMQFVTGAAFDPPPVRSGEYPLTVRAVDYAGNVGPPQTFTFNYDGTPPHTPDMDNLDGVAGGVWQNQVRTPNFSWPEPADAGSGVAGYYLYWGLDPNGTSDVLTTTQSFSSGTPIIGADNAATYYLRLRSEDRVGLQSEWVTFPFRYDGAPPVANLIANYGQDVAHQTVIHLQTEASDLGGGVAKMRLSNEGYIWTDWLDYTPEMEWEIPDVGLRDYDIYFQVQDWAGNVSEIVSDTVYLDVNIPRPHSESYDLWDTTLSAGGQVMTSTAHLLNATVGQGYDAPAVAGQQYQLVSGFQAGAQAAPTAVISATRQYVQLGSVLASGGTGDTPLQSASYALLGTLGQPSDMQVITGTQYVASLGFWGGVADVGPGEPPPPPPPPPPDCEFYSVSINDGDLFTNSPQVNLSLCAPDAENMKLSNDGGFGGAVWQPYTQTLTWTLTTYGDHVMPRYVYVRFQDSGGDIHGNFMDDIIYDPSAPSGQAAFDPTELLPGTHGPARVNSPLVVASDQADLFISALDDSSGLDEIQVSMQPDFSGAVWQPFSSILPVTFTDEGLQTVYVRFRDRAGNISNETSTTLIVDRTPPTAAPVFQQSIVGLDAISVTLTVSATDSIGEVTAMRIGSSPTLEDSIWVTYTLETPIYITYTGQATSTVYIQVRDAAGNESAVYAASYLVDALPPQGTVTVEARGETTATLRFQMQDDLSGVSQIMLSPDEWFYENVTTMPYQDELVWDFGSDNVVYIAFVDGVGNWSETYEVWLSAENKIYLPLIQR